MKIAFVAQPFDAVVPPRQNSIGLIIYNTARQLARRASVTVYLPKREGAEQVMEDDHGIVYRPIDISRDTRIMDLVDRLPIGLNHSNLFSHRAFYWFYIRKIAADARRRRFDIAHILNFSQYAPIFKRRNPQTKIALEMQCEWLVQLDRSAIRKRLRAVDLITGCSDHISGGIKAGLPELTVPCHTAYNGVDPQRFTRESGAGPCRPEQSRTILFVGRVSPEKGVHDLIEAMADVVRQAPDAQLKIVGSKNALPLQFIVGMTDDERLRGLSVFYDGTLATRYQGYLENRVAELQLQDNVEFVGAVPQAELVARYRDSRILVNPSYSESFGMSVTEGMAVGLPVVATAVGGMKELVEADKTGFLVEQGNPAQLGEALLELLQNDELCRAMGARGLRRAQEQFSWKKRADALWDYYASVT